MTTVYTASDKQLALITRLLGEKDLTGSPFAGHTVAPEGLTGGRNGTASAAIEALFALPRKDADQPEAKPGFYVRGEGAYKVQTNKAGTHTYALVWSGHSWDYRPGVARTLSGLVPMTAEQAAALGLASGRCIACAKPLGGSTLSAKVSALIGYGETCANNHGWAYPTGVAAQRDYIASRTQEPALV